MTNHSEGSFSPPDSLSIKWKKENKFFFSQLPVLIILAFGLNETGLKKQKVFLGSTVSPKPVKKKKPNQLGGKQSLSIEDKVKKATPALKLCLHIMIPSYLITAK